MKWTAFRIAWFVPWGLFGLTVASTSSLWSSVLEEAATFRLPGPGSCDDWVK
jgi:hypothetical protein